MRHIMIAAAGALVLATSGAAAESYNLSLSGASPGGLWSRIGRGVDAAIAAAYPGSTITYQTSSGGLANIGLVSRGKVPMGMVIDGELVLASAGKAPFKAPIKNLRVLIRAYSPDARFQAQHAFINRAFAKRHGISSFKDIAAKKIALRVAINRRGNLDSDIGRLVLKHAGLPLATIRANGGRVVYAASREITSLMLDRRLDMTVYGIAYNHPRVRELSRGLDVTMLQIPMPVAAAVASETGGKTCVFKAAEYKFIDQDTNSVCTGAVIVVNEKMDEKLAYNLAKGIVTQIEKYKTAHRLIKKVTTPQTLAEPGVIPFHPGAAKYLREAGLLK
ncbi:MAG: TAXI family TRAP transporter solute-binding subunit [Alphaproteobacteria bacterium]|nr:TAXI family TRAP transporter solute-binding subunit [Alphaproteobacteria bacterium]